MKLKKIIVEVYFFLFLGLGFSFGQEIIGQFQEMTNQTLMLQGFKGFTSYPIDSTTTDDQGNFKLSYTAEHQGIGLLKTQENQHILLVLEPEGIQLIGPNAYDITELTFLKGKENRAFTNYATQQPIRDQSNAAWEYLAKLYQDNELLQAQSQAKSYRYRN